MKANKYLFRILIVFVIFIISISVNSNTKENNTKFNSRVIAEGIVTLIRGGGTREIHYPSGYALKYPVWLVSPPTTNTIIFLRTNNFPLKNFIDKSVHVEGEFISVPAKKISQIHFTSAYDKIILDTIYCIN